MTEQAVEEEESSMCIVFYFQHNCICFPDEYRGYYGSDHRLHVKFPPEFCSRFDLPVSRSHQSFHTLFPFKFLYDFMTKHVGGVSNFFFPPTSTLKR